MVLNHCVYFIHEVAHFQTITLGMSLRYLDSLPEAAARNRHSREGRAERKISLFESKLEGGTKGGGLRKKRY